ncbi:type IV pilin protein [Thioalkalivibrio thiocyanoxidans]|uniref:type IV pilin protein n=1 Tax=Thioalkalivibrio thiocyanoxidans TaxID=152475 RepID=UPI00037121ED|nr:type IV pilin protein [Thioalkalivibrio thiocyanoxidans]
MDQTKRRMAGFTLIEVMIVVVVIGILAAIAYPSYQNHILKSQRADAHDALLRIQLEQERYRANNPRYADNSQLTQDRPDGLGLDAVSADGHYELAITESSPSEFTATATPQNRQANDSDCSPIILEVSGGSAERTPQDCW